MRARSPIPTASGASRAGASTGSSPSPRSSTPPSIRTMSRSNGSRTAHQRRLQLPRPPPAPSAPTRPRSSGKATIPTIEAHHLRRAPRRGLPVRQRAQVARRQEGRPRHHLPADDRRGRLAHAGLRAHRRHPLGGVRRLLGRRAEGRIEDCGVQDPDQRRRGLRGGRKCRPRPTPTRRRRRDRVKNVIVVKRTGGDVPMDAGRDVWLRRGGRRRLRRLPARADERRAPALHPLHLGLDRHAQGRPAHHRRLPGLRRDDTTNTSSTITTATSTGAPPTSAGSPATATSSTARSPTARPR